MFQLFSTSDAWFSLITLTVLEIVLGIDNLVFISVITHRLPTVQQKTARRVGLFLACLMRLVLLAAIVWITHLTYPLFTVAGQSFSWRDIILILGGLFLLAKATSEIHVSVLHESEHHKKQKKARFLWVILQIMVLDIIFSLDSVITAVGLAKEFIVMALAIIIAVALMVTASEFLSRVIHTYPSLKMLALSFLLLVGIVLVADGFSFHVPRGYLYFAIAFSLSVEMLNILAYKRRLKPVKK